MESPEKKTWFKKKKHGYGWIPDSWEGYAVTGLFFIGLLWIGADLQDKGSSDKEAVIRFFVPFCIMSVLFVLIVWKKGEKFGKPWDEKSEEKNNKNDQQSKF